MRTSALSLFALAAFGLTACASSTQRESFSLPEGDPEAGKKVFVQAECSFCHAVEGVDDIPEPVADPPVPVVFGRGQRPSDGQLVRSIVDPSHFVSPAYPEATVKMDGESRMPKYRNTLTVQQLIDLVAFLRDAY